ncbi:hypothetical protein [Arthrobacter zhaoguopingii]|uniref:hypothetical protein n=1 Tax=Arthrobacter zhaoguopingii TaxID=2681491 RepID=UPI001357A95E|nr:hypothetical protein [Arthrobacter zhaoguopingii]
MEYLEVLLPSATLAVLFYFVMRTILNADRSEREAMSRARELHGEEDRSRDEPTETSGPESGPDIDGTNSAK